MCTLVGENSVLSERIDAPLTPLVCLKNKVWKILSGMHYMREEIRKSCL